MLQTSLSIVARALGCACLGLLAGCVSEPTAMPGAASPDAELHAGASFDSEAVIAYWECTAGELEETAREVAINVTGPRGPQHSRPLRCLPGPSQARPFAPLPVSDNAGLARANVADLIDRASALDPSLRLFLDERGTAHVRSVELERLRARVRATPKRERATLAPELRRRLDVASELAVRLSPLGRSFARSHATTQLVHAYTAALVAERGGAIEAGKLQRLVVAARRTERAAAVSTALLAVVQAGLSGSIASKTLLDTTRAARDTLSDPVRVGDSDPELAATWCPRSAHVIELRAYVARYLRDPAGPRALPDLADIADSATARASSDDDYLLRGYIRDAQVVPFVVSAVYPEASAPRRSAESVRAVLDGEAKAALHHARAMVGPSSLDLVLALAEGQLLLAQLDSATRR